MPKNSRQLNMENRVMPYDGGGNSRRDFFSFTQMSEHPVFLTEENVTSFKEVRRLFREFVDIFYRLMEMEPSDSSSKVLCSRDAFAVLRDVVKCSSPLRVVFNVNCTPKVVCSLITIDIVDTKQCYLLSMQTSKAQTRLSIMSKALPKRVHHVSPYIWYPGKTDGTLTSMYPIISEDLDFLNLAYHIINGEEFRQGKLIPVANLFQKPNDLSQIQPKYNDVKHYLKTVQSLLVEDFMRSIREGIAECKKAKIGTRKVNEVKDLYVYWDVSIIAALETDRGIVHLLSFDPESTRNVCWLQSNRLLHGSLVCLSSDDFESYLVGTVFERNDDVSNGLVLVMFEDLASSAVYMQRSGYVMIEPAVYLEAYKHNIHALSRLDPERIPMKDYIVYGTTEVKPSKVLSAAEELDLTPIMKDKSKPHIYPYLDFEKWPAQEEFELNPSQLAALQGVLSQEFTLIQGPPGTGKTYLGLKIIHLLVHNWHRWKGSSPIMVVCYTNHALDNFLEKVAEFTPHIIRLGGGCSRPDVLKFKLLNNTWKGALARPYYDACMEITSEMDHKLHMLSHLHQSIPNERDLAPVMKKSHLKQLNKYENCAASFQCSKIAFWLGILPEFPERFKASSEKPTRSEVTTAGPAASGTSEDLSVGVMTPEEANSITDIWDLDFGKRLELYMYWRALLLEETAKECRMLQENYESISECYRAIKNFEMAPYVKKTKVLGMTTTGAAKYRDLLENVKPNIILIEEAAEVLEAHVITAMMESTEHVILIGDHKQLRPSTAVHELSQVYKMNVSLFERIIMNGLPYHRLNTQHRMRPCFAELLVPHVYPELFHHSSVTTYENIKGVASNMFFLDHNMSEDIVMTNKSRANTFEAQFIAEFCRYLIYQGHDPKSITILSPYAVQVSVFRNFMNHEIFQNVEVSTVDNFQGEENDIVLVSFVRSNPQLDAGFVRHSNRICVALSRAKKGLYCIGNFSLLAKTSNLWRRILQKVASQNAAGRVLRLVCSNHPLMITRVSSAADFSLVQGGGCLMYCRKPLPCGHVCPRRCHTDDLNHEELVCTEKCSKVICSEGHTCPLACFQKCFTKCSLLTKKKFPNCGHSITVPCYVSVNDYECRNPCPKILSCGHTCTSVCSKKCPECCVPSVKILLKCLHTVTVPCHKPLADIVCPNSCERLLPCGHRCQDICGVQCPECTLKVFKKVPWCHHMVKVPCSVNEFSCTLPCPRILSCGHKCSRRCGEDCGKCQILVENKLACGHYRVTTCRMSSRDLPCNRRCMKTLPCGHACIGYCGTPCNPCDLLVKRQLPCGHMQILPCNQSLDKWKCDERCLRKLSCGHRCCYRCHEPCGDCTILVEEMQKCGTLRLVPCLGKALPNRKSRKSVTFGPGPTISAVVKVGAVVNCSCAQDTPENQEVLDEGKRTGARRKIRSNSFGKAASRERSSGKSSAERSSQHKCASVNINVVCEQASSSNFLARDVQS